MSVAGSEIPKFPGYKLTVHIKDLNAREILHKGGYRLRVGSPDLNKDDGFRAHPQVYPSDEPLGM